MPLKLIKKRAGITDNVRAKINDLNAHIKAYNKLQTSIRSKRKQLSKARKSGGRKKKCTSRVIAVRSFKSCRLKPGNKRKTCRKVRSHTRKLCSGKKRKKRTVKTPGQALEAMFDVFPGVVGA